MILTDNQEQIINVFDRISVDTLIKITEEDRVVDKLKGEINVSPGILRSIVNEMDSLRAQFYKVEFDNNELKKDMKKLLNVIERANGYNLNVDYEYQSLKSKYVNYY